MKIYIFALMSVMLVTLLSKLHWFAKGYFPERKPTEEAMDIFAQIIFLIWGSVLVFN